MSHIVQYKATELEKELRQITKKKNEAVRGQDFDKAFEAYMGLLLVKSAAVGVVSEWQVVTYGILALKITYSQKHMR
ncbi:hypothetical protein L1887_29400 [Cichorium endivia]|nr:hypothetical protein L1887_29400 [Cichorium endivia]